MRLSWNEVRARAAAFADDWRDAAYEKGETQSFYNAFFDVFGVRRRNVARYEEHVAKLDNRHGYINLFWPGVLLVEQKSAGRDLKAAYEQAGEYFDALSERDRPRFILVSDFQTFELHDLDEREVVSFALVDLPVIIPQIRDRLVPHRAPIVEVSGSEGDREIHSQRPHRESPSRLRRSLDASERSRRHCMKTEKSCDSNARPPSYSQMSEALYTR